MRKAQYLLAIIASSVIVPKIAPAPSTGYKEEREGGEDMT